MSEFMILPKTEEGYLIFESEEEARNFAGEGDVVVEFLQLFDIEDADDSE
jgi:hypothetical protein